MKGISVNQLFSSGVQYEIPVYQRRYVWQEVNWQQLWIDIEHQADLRIYQNPRSHFTGIIITNKKESGVGVPKYEIIDGQQRLTTFQIILCVIRDICNSGLNDHQNIAASADRHIKNEDFFINLEDRNTHDKFLPTMYDRAAFQGLVDNEENDSDLLINKAYHYFKEQIGDYIGDEYTKIQSLFASITQDFSLVQIDLNPDDEPEKIFASLNATGRMLYEVDYLRNDLFLRAGKAGEEERQRLYDEYWKHFENCEFYWDSKKLEDFLHDFLRAKLGPACFQGPQGRTVKAFDLYQTRYGKVLAEKDKNLDDEFKELMRYSEIYQKIDTHIRARFYKLFDITGWYSFILDLIADKKIKEDDLEQLFHVLESYTVRRMLCYGTKYKSPNTANFLPRIIKQIRTQSNYSIEELIRLLGESTKPYQWPNDDLVKNSLRRYGDNIDEDFLSYILYRIEFQDQVNPSTEELGQFVRQHVMPLRWEGEKPLPVGMEYMFYNDLFKEDYKNKNPRWAHRPYEDGLVDNSEPYKTALRLALDRKDMVHSIGNIMIVDPSRPGRISGKWDEWDVEQIQKRTDELIECFCKIWPSANSFIGEITCKSDEMIKSGSYQFMTYEGIKSFSNINLEQYAIRVTGDNSKKDVVLRKDNILFAFPKAMEKKWPSENHVARKNLTPVSRSDAKQVSKVRDEELKNTKKQGNYVELVTRGGHVLCGVVEDFDLYCIYMQINGQMVIVYRHGLYSFKKRLETQEALERLHKIIQSKSYVFITAEGEIVLSQIEPSLNYIDGSDKDRRRKRLEKQHIFFACPSDEWSAISEKIGFNQNRKYRKSRGKCSSIPIKDFLLQSAQKYDIEIVTCYGDVTFQGKVEEFDGIAIYIKIDEYKVIVFKHGVHKLSTPEWHKSKVMGPTRNENFNFIKFSKRKTNNGRIYVHESQVQDKNILPLRKDQEVKFRVEYTEKGLRAIDVKGT